MFFAIALLFSLAAQGDPINSRSMSHFRMPVFGTVHGDKAYGLFEPADSFLFRVQSIDLKKSENESRAGYVVLNGGGAYHRFRVGFNRVWLCEGYPVIKVMPFDELDLFNYTSNPDGRKEYLKKCEKCKGEPGFIALPTLAKKPFEKAALQFVVVGLTGLAIVPTSENTLKTFLLLDGKTEMEIWDTEARFDKKTMTWETIADQKNMEKLESAFREDFYAFIHKDTYYFVTESGKLFYTQPPVKGEKKRTMKGRWEFPVTPIVAVIEDADQDRVWLFAKNKARTPSAISISSWPIAPTPRHSSGPRSPRSTSWAGPRWCWNICR